MTSIHASYATVSLLGMQKSYTCLITVSMQTKAQV